MVVCIGISTFLSVIGAYNSATDETEFFDFEDQFIIDSENDQSISALFEYIKNEITKDYIDYLCITMEFIFTNEYRKKFIDAAKMNNVGNVRIIGEKHKDLCDVIAEFSMSPKYGDVVWVFEKNEDLLECTIWKYKKRKGWKCQDYVARQISDMTLEDLQKFREKMPITTYPPYIMVNYAENCEVNKEDFETCFSDFQRIDFNEKGQIYSCAALNYACSLAKNQISLKYKCDSLVDYDLSLKNNDTDIDYHGIPLILPFSKAKILYAKKNDKIQMYTGSIMRIEIPILETGEYHCQLNIDINGIYQIHLNQMFTNFGDEKHFSIPTKLPYYNTEFDAFGIDFGTTECCAAVMRKNGPDFVVLDEFKNSRTMPSYMAFDEENPKFGQIVVNRMKQKSKFSVFDTKRIIGKHYEEVILDPLWPFKIILAANNAEIEVETFEETAKKTCEEIIADFLSHIKNAVEKFQAKILTEVVITVPSKFTVNQKNAILIAAENAGFTKIILLPEPVAAAFAYVSELNYPIPNESHILICDCGGGTTDICVAKVTNKILEVLNIDGDSYLGGRDFDKLLFTHFSAILKDKFEIDVMENYKKYILMQKCIDVKHTLSTEKNDWIDLGDFICDGETLITITQEKFEELAGDLLLKMKSIICRSVEAASLQRSQINYVFQVGGGCRMPMIEVMLKEIFPDSEHERNRYPDWVVAHGAALYSFFLKQRISKKKKAT